MSFQIVGDDVYYMGEKVMTFVDTFPTVREKVRCILETMRCEYEYDDEDDNP